MENTMKIVPIPGENDDLIAELETLKAEIERPIGSHTWTQYSSMDEAGIGYQDLRNAPAMFRDMADFIEREGISIERIISVKWGPAEQIKAYYMNGTPIDFGDVAGLLELRVNYKRMKTQKR